MYNTCAILDNFGLLINPIRGDAFVKRNKILTYLFTNKKQCVNDF